MRKYLVLLMVLVLPAMLLTVSCAKKTVGTEPAVTEAPAQPSTADADAEKARIEAERLREQQEREQAAQKAAAAARNQFVNEDIYFEFDSASLLPAAQKVLGAKAEFMRANAAVRVTVEGHCDERGTDAYNLALGQRRADAARDYMVKLGIDGSRLNTISYGEERPVDPGHTEEAWTRNRRAHFVIN